ncbi:MAG: aldo/keto reductase [Devosia sp.]|nr:aldo/keto reductase [Devosia sp.]
MAAGTAGFTFSRRRVGGTALEVTELGVGSASLAGNLTKVEDSVARETLARGLDLGINYFDTAPQYGFGRAEHLVGDGLRFRTEGTVISTKVGRLLKPHANGAPYAYGHGWVDPFPFDQVYDYSYDGIMRSFEDSLQRLGLDAVQMLLVHDIGAMTHGAEQNAIYWQQLADGGYRALNDLKSAGLIKAIGLGVNEWEVLMDAFALGDWDVFLLAGRYTLLEQTSLSPFLTTCLERNASVICGGPFNGGALMGSGMWNYSKAPEAVLQRVKALEAACTEFGIPLGAAALQFPLAHQAICTILPGPRTPAELDGILNWWQVAIPDQFWDALADRRLVEPGTPLPNGRTA